MLHTLESRPAVSRPRRLSKRQSRQLESSLEDYFVMRCRECGLEVVKLNPQACKGIPDRLVMDPQGFYPPRFVELKRDFAAKATPLQAHMARALKTVFVRSADEAESALYSCFRLRYVPHGSAGVRPLPNAEGASNV